MCKIWHELSSIRKSQFNKIVRIKEPGINKNTNTMENNFDISDLTLTRPYGIDKGVDCNLQFENLLNNSKILEDIINVRDANYKVLENIINVRNANYKVLENIENIRNTNNIINSNVLNWNTRLDEVTTNFDLNLLFNKSFKVNIISN